VADRPLLIQVLGDSGSGKTLVVARCVRRLVSRGYSVAVVKHSHHTPDLRGKDSARFSAAGARLVLFAGPTSFLTFRGVTVELIRSLPVDVVLVEGYSRRSFGPLRFSIRAPSEAPGLVRRILERVPERRDRPRALLVDGRRTRSDPVWRFVANVMAHRGVRELRSEP
jgi:molybdopterin-guanine dinucleotide biosynthesis adapter protein